MNPKIKTAGSLAKEAMADLNKFQVGEKKLLKTGREYVDKHIGGVLPGDLILIGASSGVGKTFEMMKIIRLILDSNVNTLSNDYVVLEFMLEMKYLNFILRDVNRLIKKDKSKILTETFTEYEKQAVKEYYNELKDGRRFVVDESITSKEFLDISREFCIANKDKSSIIITIDHILLVLSDNGFEDPLKKLAEYTNILRKEFSNVYFIFLSQLNRGIYDDVQEKSNKVAPNTSHIYGSSHFEFLSSFVVIMFNPFKMGVQQYMQVRKDRYPELSEFYGEENGKGDRVSFDTVGNMFFHVVKIRESDKIYDNLFIESMNIPQEQLDKLRMDVKETYNDTFGKVEMPKFNNSFPDVGDDFEDVPF